MKEYYFLSGSVTTAMKGEEALRRAGYRAYVFKDEKINPYGCGYVIKAKGDKEAMLNILKNRGIKIRGVEEAE